MALALAPGAAVLEALFTGERTRDAVTLSLDLNLRPSIVGNRARERQRVERQLRLAHLVKASEEDLAWLCPDRSVDVVMAGWRTAGVVCSVVMLGAGGSRLLAPDGTMFRRPARSVDVVDTVGAGDAFTGGLLAALAEADALGDRPADRLASVPAERWPVVLDHADAVAALACTRRGADQPTRAEVDALLGRRDVADRVPTTTGHGPGPVS